MKIFNTVLYFCIFILLLFTLTGCREEQMTINNKVEDELNFFSVKSINILNRLNNITFENYDVVAEKVELSKESAENEKSSNSDSKTGSASVEESDGQKQNIIAYQMSPNTILNPVTNEIDWPGLKNEIENIYYSWNTVLLDLYELDVTNEQILGFSSDLDKATVYIKKEDKANSLLAMANLYKYLPKYAETISDDEEFVNILKTKSFIVNAYSLVITDDWDAVNEEIDKAIEIFKNITSDTDFISKNYHCSNKIYVLLNELKNSLALKDIDIFYIKYKNLMEEITRL